MSIKSNKTERNYILSLSILSALIVSFLIRTITIKIVYFIFAFFLTLVLLLLLLSDKSMFSIEIKNRILRNSRIPINVFHYTLALLATIFILAFPAFTINIDPNSMWNSFASLPLISLLRVISAFFLTSVFPGIIIYSNLMRNCDLNLFERIGLILLLSYCFTTISGLVLLWLQVFSNFGFIIVLWISAGILGVYKYLKRRDEEEVLKKHVFSFDTNLIALMLVGGALVVLSYIQVLTIAPLTGIVGGDVIDYMVTANRFIHSEVFGWAPYVWSNIFYWLNASLAGIPMHYVYAGLQFYQIIFASAFYFFVRTLFPERRKVAAVATLLCFFVAGVNSWLMINQMITSSSVFEGYIGGNTVGILSFILQHTGSAGLTPLSLSPFAFEFGLIFYALAFTYRGMFMEKRKLIDYFLPALFASAAFFTHNLNILLIFVLSILSFSLFLATSRKYVVTVLSLTVVFTILFDPLSKWFLSNTLLGIMATWDFQSVIKVFDATHVILVLVIIVVAAFAFFIFYKKKKRLLHDLTFIHDSREIFSRSYIKVAFYVMGFSVFFASIILYFLNYESLMYTKIWGLQEYVFPWYYIIFRSYGIILPFALASIPFVTKIKKNTLIFIFGFSLSILIPAVLSLVFPAVIPPSIGYTRYSAYLLYPFSILAALALLQSVKLLKKKNLRILALLTLVVLVSTSILSQAYSRELYYLTGQSKTVSDATAESIEWINSNIPRGSSILPLTESSEQLLSNLASGIYVIPNFQVWWLRDALLKSRPEVILYSLSEIGVDYVFVRNGDFPTASNGSQVSYFESTMLSFPEVYRNDEVTIFKVPDFPIYEDSRLILVNPSSDADESSIATAYSFLIASGTKFATADDVDLSGLKSGYTYLFPSGESIPMTPKQVLEHIEQGASVISLDSKFVCQILNITYPDESQTIVPTNTLDGWTIAQGAQGKLAIGKSSLPNSFVFAENASATSGGALIYNYTSTSPLDLKSVSSIKLWVKTNAVGNFYLGLFSDPNNYEVWYGKYTATYKIEPDDVNEWVQVTLPIDEPTFIQPGFNSSKVSCVRIGVDGLAPEQEIEFSTGGFQALEEISGVNFMDGASFPLSAQNYEAYLPSFGQVLANYSREDGSEIPYVEYARIGNGSLLFMNTAPLINTQQMKGSGFVLNHTGAMLRSLLNTINSPKEEWNLPQFNDLFADITFSRFQMLFNLTHLAGKMLWNNNVSVFGNIEVDSNRIYLADEQLPIEMMNVWSIHENLVFENLTLHNAVFTGEGNILLQASNTTIVSSPAGLYSIIYVNGSKNCNINLSKANVTFQLNISDGAPLFSLSNVNVTLRLQQPTFLVIKCKQPTLQIDGSVSGVAQGLLTWNGRQYIFRQERTELSGKFELEIAYCSNVIFSEISRVNELKVQSPID